MSWDYFQKVLPSTAAIGSAGGLEIGGCDAADLVREYGSPLFVLDYADVRDRLRAYRDAFGGPNVYYASKAFLSKAFASVIEEEGLCLEVLAGGELYVALAADFPAPRIAVHGNNKSRSELVEALGLGCNSLEHDLRQILDARCLVARLISDAEPATEVELGQLESTLPSRLIEEAHHDARRFHERLDLQDLGTDVRVKSDKL